jgi:cation diffusion facilitator family transporter
MENIHMNTHPTHATLGMLHQPMESSSGLHYGQAKTSAVEEHTAMDDGSRHRSAPGYDTESQAPAYSSQADPLDLSRRVKTQAELDSITANSARKRDNIAYCNPVNLGRKPASKVAGFYESQNSQIERLLKPVHEHVREAKDSQESTKFKYLIAVYGSFGANIVLSIIQLYAAISSGSLSLFTTAADSVFDPLSNVTLILCNKAVTKVDPRKFPAGRARIENAGNIVFAFLMVCVSFILIAFSIQDLVQHAGTSETKSFYLPSVIAVSVAFTTKLCLFFYCWGIKGEYSQVRILWEDHRNDLFINGFGILTSVGGSKLVWWLDPMGAIILSVLISCLWLHTAYEEFQLLIGITADTETLQLITYVSMTHSDAIKQIDTVRAWHSGPRLVVEVDIVMDPEDTLRATHDVAEELQMKLESLPDVERAYVHVDFETTHKPEHFLKKEL